MRKPAVIGRRANPIQMSLSEPRVSIVILNWNSYQVTLDCLLSLRKMDYRNFEVVLVDNGSVDDSPVKLLENVPLDHA
jgi:GT2 family glycosyltransferase